MSDIPINLREGVVETIDCKFANQFYVESLSEREPDNELCDDDDDDGGGGGRDDDGGTNPGGGDDPAGSRSTLVGFTPHAHAHFSLDSAVVDCRGGCRVRLLEREVTDGPRTDENVPERTPVYGLLLIPPLERSAASPPTLRRA